MVAMPVKEARMDKLADLAKACEGQIIDGKFRLLKFLGGSGESAVFLTARGGHAAAPAVIKLVANSDAAADREQLARWAEAEKIVHPNLIRLFEMGHAELGGAGVLYLVMECAEQDLSQVLPERPLTMVETREMLQPTLAALTYIHGKGFAHGGVKPSNVMSIGNQLKLASDRIAQAGAPNRTQSKLSAYDAPEGRTSAQADMWALGVTLTEALTQHAPGAGGVGSEVLPAPFDDIVRRCMARNPEQRPKTDDVVRRLQQSPPAENAVGRSIEAAQMPTVRESAMREPAVQEQAPPTHWRAFSSILAPILAGVILLAFVVYVVKRFKPSPEPSSAAATSVPQQQNAPPPAPDARSADARPAAENGEAAQSSASSATPAVPVIVGVVAHQVQPEVSAGALATIQGTVKVAVEVDVNAAGHVVDARFTRRGPSKYFAQRAIAAARQWEFTPRKLRGENVSSTWPVRFEFKRNGTSAAAKESAT